LPSVDRVLQLPALEALLRDTPRTLVVESVRTVLESARRGDGPAPADWATSVSEEIDRRMAPSLRSVINATGVVLHTNLGRAPLAREAIEAVGAVAAGYSTLEFDLAEGVRGSRSDHCRGLLTELTGAEDALVVNNAAGALALVLNAAAEGAEVIISRGELIEIGGSFRIPDIVVKSGVHLREVGTTNRTHLADYADAVEARTGAILTVHRSNFEQSGFVATPGPAELVHLASEHKLPYLHDVGSGLLLDLSSWGLRGEPLVREAVATGADAVVFSGDKLLGGPQAGCVVGTSDLIERCRSNPLARTLRADKMTLAALAATLHLYRDGDSARRAIPVLRMLTADPEDLSRRARALADGMPDALQPGVQAGQSAVGGGAFPEAPLPTTLVVLSVEQPQALAGALRTGAPSVIARVAGNALVLDPRTIEPHRDAEVVAAVTKASQA
jgi:L-seryl-tRNA(Ser) seleniumtransferase